MFSSYLKRVNEYKYGKLIIVENKKYNKSNYFAPRYKCIAQKLDS